MTEDIQYTLWVKPGTSDADLQAVVRELQGVEGVISANALPLPGTGVTSREVVMAITLSVLANFTTDGLKAVFQLVTADETNEIIMCRRPDGTEENLEAINASPDSTKQSKDSKQKGGFPSLDSGRLKSDSRTLWMVRAGKKGVYIDDFIESSFVGIGFPLAGELTSPIDKATIIKRMNREQPHGKFQMAASQIKRFYDEFKQGDLVITYDPGQSLYFLGEIISDVQSSDHALARCRLVSWKGQIVRDTLTQATRNSLGAISTLFMVRGDAAKEILSRVEPLGSEPTAPLSESIGESNTEVEDSESENLFENIETRANDLLEDLIVKLDWEQMQQLVAEILIAMGFKAEISPRGSDRGIDIFASHDGLGLTEPRIFVEVKHRHGTRMGADQIRSFLGGRQSGDRCLYVSTGGFSKEARYEAERSNIPVKLIDLPRLRELVIEHYQSFSTDGVALLPLKRILWPA